MTLTDEQWNYVRGFRLPDEASQVLRKHPVVELEGSVDDIALATLLRANEIAWALHALLIEEDTLRDNVVDYAAQARRSKAKALLDELSNVAAAEFWVACSTLAGPPRADRLAQLNHLIQIRALGRGDNKRVVLLNGIGRQQRASALAAGGPGR